MREDCLRLEHGTHEQGLKNVDFPCAPWNRKETVSSRVTGSNSSAEQILCSTAKVSVLVIPKNLGYEWSISLSLGSVCSLSAFFLGGGSLAFLVHVLQPCACGLGVEGDHLELGSCNLLDFVLLIWA